MANPFTYLELHSTDASRAKSFYSELFGWKTKDTPVPGIGVYTEIDTQEGPEAGLMTQQEPGARSAWLAYIKVPELDQTVARAQKLGATVIAPRTEIKDVGWFAVLQDPSGARIGVFEKGK
jgi:predicted enzyme related to lactoylglutathione lyase